MLGRGIPEHPFSSPGGCLCVTNTLAIVAPPGAGTILPGYSKKGVKNRSFQAASAFPSLNAEAEKGWNYKLNLMSNASSQ